MNLFVYLRDLLVFLRTLGITIFQNGHNNVIFRIVNYFQRIANFQNWASAESFGFHPQREAWTSHIRISGLHFNNVHFMEGIFRAFILQTLLCQVYRFKLFPLFGIGFVWIKTLKVLFICVLLLLILKRRVEYHFLAFELQNVMLTTELQQNHFRVQIAQFRGY